MQKLDRDSRRQIACAYEPALELATPWTPAALNPRWEGERPSVCPGYLISLPQVLEASRARMHWLKNQLETHLGARPTDQLQRAIELLEAGYCEIEQLRDEERRAS